jgi:hypothetical protein
MQILELLNKTYNLLQNHFSHTSNVSFTSQHVVSITTSGLTQKLIQLEESLSWQELLYLINNHKNKSVDENSLIPFITFLRERWSRIGSIYQLTYFVNYKNPLTKVCFTLATELSAIEFEGNLFHAYERLMPTINSYNAILESNLVEQEAAEEAQEVADAIKAKEKEIQAAESKQAAILAQAKAEAQAIAHSKKMQLHHFILDSWQSVVQIQTSIEAAIEEGVVQHTSSLVTVINEYGRVSDFKLVVIGHGVPMPALLEQRTMYIRLEQNHLAYVIRGMSGFAQIKPSQININTLITEKEIMDLEAANAWEALKKLHANNANDARKTLELRQLELLECAAANGHVFIPKAPTALSRQDRLRIIYHSKEGYEFYQAIKAVINEKNTVADLYEAISRLRRELCKGGERGNHGGSEKRASAPAFQGIREFYNFTLTLTREDFKVLWELDRVDQKESFREIWSQLLGSIIHYDKCDLSDVEKKDIHELINPYFLKLQESHKKKIKMEMSILCAEQFDLRLKDFQKRHSLALKSIKSKLENDIKQNTLQTLEKVRDAKQQAFIAAINQNNLTHFSVEAEYNTEAQAACNDVVPLVKFIKAMVTSVDNLIFILNRLPKSYHAHVLFYLSNKYEVVLMREGIMPQANKLYVGCKDNQLEYIVENPIGIVVNGKINDKNINNISSVFSDFSITKLEMFLPAIFSVTTERNHTAYHPEFLQQLINSGAELANVVRSIQPNSDTVKLLVNHLGMKYIKNWFNLDSLAFVRHLLPQEIFPQNNIQTRVLNFFKGKRNKEDEESTLSQEDASTTKRVKSESQQDISFPRPVYK